MARKIFLASKVDSQSLKELIIPIVSLFIFMIISHFHSSFEEWDGVMQYFAGKDIFSGLGYHGWPAKFWPPLYSFLIGLFSNILSGFFVAKMISSISAAFTLIIAYRLAVVITNDQNIAFLTQIFILLNPIFFLSAIQAENHMIDTVFFVFSIFLLVKFITSSNGRSKDAFLVGIANGFAGLSRYTSYVLVVISIISIMFLIKRKRFILISVLIIGFVAVNLPWWIENFIKNGSPLYNWQYLNIGSAVFPNSNEWWWKEQSKYSSIVQIIQNYPISYFKNFLKNILNSGLLVMRNSTVFALFTIPAIFSSLLHYKFKIFLIIISQLILFILIVSQAFVFSQVFLSWIVIFTVLNLSFFFNFLDQVYKKYPIFEKIKIRKILILIFLFSGSFLLIWKTFSYIRSDKIDEGQLIYVDRVTQLLQQYDPLIANKTIMSVNPARAYYLGSNWLMSPLYYEGTIEDLVKFKNIDIAVRNYAPKYPLNQNINTLKADYLIYDIGLKQHLPEYSFLLEEFSTKIPDTFIRIFYSPEVAVYKIN